MRSEFDFELRKPRLPLRWLAAAGLLLLLSVLYSSISLWRGYTDLREARAEVEQLQWQMQSRLQSRQPTSAQNAEDLTQGTGVAQRLAPAYAADAHEALRLLQWSFDDGLRELEHCLPDTARVTGLQLDGLTRQSQAVVELPTTGPDSQFDKLLTCMNTGHESNPWNISQITVTGSTSVTASSELTNDRRLSLNLIRRTK